MNKSNNTNNTDIKRDDLEKKRVIECKVYTSFDDMKLKDSVLRGIYAYGFEKPSKIQQKGIVLLYGGNDLIAQSQSGTGKTATFVIGILQKIDETKQITQALILAPTRELARQIFTVTQCLSNNMNIEITLNIGGMRQFNQSFKEKNPQIIVGTPGRVLDMLKREKIDSSGITTFILDEADEILSRGFADQIYNIFQFLNNDTQVGLFSATIPEEILKLTEKFMTNPFKLLVKRDELTLEGIQQYYVTLDKDVYKYDTLCDLYSSIRISQAIIYCNKKKRVIELTENMNNNDFVVSCMHSDMPQEDRNSIMKEFRSGRTRVLITTDILARGIDVQQVSLVINYDIPYEKETYIHRIGRSGRFGRKGIAINFITSYDVKQLREIERFYNTQIEELPANINKLI